MKRIAYFLLILSILATQGCTSFISIGKQYDLDEIEIKAKQYHSEPDLSPEVLKLLEGWLAGQDHFVESDEMLVGADFNGYQLSKWSRAVRARDGSCFMCGCICDDECPCEAHHIAPKSKYPETAYSMWNGITLCRKCHDIVHSTKESHKKYIPMFYDYTFSFEGPIP